MALFRARMYGNPHIDPNLGAKAVKAKEWILDSWACQCTGLLLRNSVKSPYLRNLILWYASPCANLNDFTIV